MPGPSFSNAVNNVGREFFLATRGGPGVAPAFQLVMVHHVQTDRLRRILASPLCALALAPRSNVLHQYPAHFPDVTPSFTFAMWFLYAKRCNTKRIAHGESSAQKSFFS